MKLDYFRNFPKNGKNKALVHEKEGKLKYYFNRVI